jgi:hypothetical protein
VDLLGANFAVPFAARKFRSPDVVWLNRRWLFERGVDVSDKHALAQIEHWLLDEFACAVPRERLLPPDSPRTSALGRVICDGGG